MDECQSRDAGPTALAVSKVLVVAVLGAAWAARRLTRTYFYFDEWSMIGRVTQLGPVEGATTSFNGHLWVFQDAIFRIQANVFGLDSNSFLVATFLVSLVALHLSLAALVVRIGVPLMPALLLGGLLTYLGPAAQNFVFAIQVSPTFATAAAVAAATSALRGPVSMRRQVTVAGLLLASTLFDSGVGLVALTLGGGVVLGCWPRRKWWVVAPGLLSTAVWYAFGDLGPEFEASVPERIVFTGRLLVRGAGALVGSGAWAGGVVLVVFAVATAVAISTRRLDRRARIVMCAAAAATFVNVVGIAQSRAGLPGFTFFENNRYLQNVAIPLTITFLPAVVACAGLVADRWRETGPAPRVLRRAMPVVLLAGCFVLGLDEEREYADVFIARNESVREGVDDISVVTTSGCPPGSTLDRDARPLGNVSPQVSASLVDELTRRGLLTVEAGDARSVDPEILRSICQP